MEKTQIQGAAGPLLGVRSGSSGNGDHSIDEVLAGNSTSARTGCLEERGRASGTMEAKKRNSKFLEKVAQEIRLEKEGSAKKRSKGPRKKERDSPSGGVQDIRKWFEGKGEAPGQAQGRK